MFLTKKEENDYYEQSEKEMRNIRFDSSVTHDPSYETSPAQHYRKGGCPLLILTILLKLTLLISLIFLS